MPTTPVLTRTTILRCPHGGVAHASVSASRVLVEGQAALLQSVPLLITGCPFAVDQAPSACLTAAWLTGSTRVLSGGHPLALASSASLCTPSRVPLLVDTAQNRVRAT